MLTLHPFQCSICVRAHVRVLYSLHMNWISAALHDNLWSAKWQRLFRQTGFGLHHSGYSKVTQPHEILTHLTVGFMMTSRLAIKFVCVCVFFKMTIYPGENIINELKMSFWPVSSSLKLLWTQSSIYKSQKFASTVWLNYGPHWTVRMKVHGGFIILHLHLPEILITVSLFGCFLTAFHNC